MDLRVLIVDDDRSDALLLVRAMVHDGFVVHHGHVTSHEEMLRALRTAPWDVILTDFNMPGFGALPAIELRNEIAPEIPIIVVSGSIGEEAAVDALRLGAHDFVNKDNLARLGPAIRRELREVAQRQQRERVERQLRAIFETTIDAILLSDDEGRFVDANPAACALLGVDHARLVQMTIADLAPVEPRRFGGARTGFVAEGRESGLLEIRGASGELRTVEYQAIGGVLPGVHLSVLRDVTERQQLRARLALADRLASIGTIAAGVVHEINNPLTFVAANVSHLVDLLEQGNVPDPTSTLDILRDAAHGADRISTILRDVRAFARQDVDAPVAVDVNAVLRSALRVAGVRLRGRAVATLELAAVPKVRATESRLAQVFLNLIVNAAQAMPDRDADANVIRLRTSQRDGFVAAEVIDNGLGIPPEHVPRLFTPFFTTKPMESGTGLGLSICHDIVTSFGGHIEVDTASNRGSTFTVLLPVHASELGAQPPASDGRAAGNGG